MGFLCHFRRLIHLSMIFRRRFLKHLFENDQMLERFVDFYQNKPFPRTTLHGYILQMLWDIFNHDQREDDEEDENKENNELPSDDPELEEQDSVVINEDDEDEQNENNEKEQEKEQQEDNEEEEEEFGDDIVLKPNFSKAAEDQWDIVAFFNKNKVWKQFIVTVSIQMEMQNATETQVPNMNVANNQEQLDQLLQNLLGPNNEGGDDDSSDSDSDSDDEDV